jgi:hypothetical protein
MRPNGGIRRYASAAAGAYRLMLAAVKDALFT